MPKNIVIITIATVALVVVGAVAYLGLSQAPKQGPQGQGGQGIREKEQPVATLPEPASEVDTSDWKTYRNEKYGFEVRYPAGWIFEAKEPKTEYPLLETDQLLSVYFHIPEKLYPGFSISLERKL